MLSSGVTGFCFESKLRKSSDDPFFGRHKGNLETFAKFVLQRHWKLCTKIPLAIMIQTTKVRNNRLFGNYSAKSPKIDMV